MLVGTERAAITISSTRHDIGYIYLELVVFHN